MPLAQKHTWLIAYDIASPRRLANVHRFIKNVAVPVQYSLYVTSASTSEIDAVYHQLEKRIHPGEDDIRIYRLVQGTQIVRFGLQSLPEGLFVIQARPSAAWQILDPKLP